MPQFSGLRGIAALLVLFYHVRTPQHLELNFGVCDVFSKFGYLGVDVFFVLSGFILSHVYRDGFNLAGLRSYGVARFARIYPLHLVTLFMMLGAYAIALRVGVQPTEASGYGWLGTITGLLLVQEWFGLVAPNPGSWSISIEFANYLLFPLLMLLPRFPRYLAPIVLLFGALIVEGFGGVRVMRPMTEFVMGCAAYSIATRYSYKSVPALAGLTFALPFIVAGLLGREFPGLAALSFAATMILLSGTAREPFKDFCASRPMVFIGEISYSVYLLQWFVWIGWKHGIAKIPFFAAHSYVMVLAAAASVVACAVPSFFCLSDHAARCFAARSQTINWPQFQLAQPRYRGGKISQPLLSSLVDRQIFQQR
ncbi:MAG: acyltransferase [Pseudolabrys sp.]